ncbi:MAG: decaprenyl-phosphate phosphoribosyltransferase [Prevotella sp.]|nr:decaprenyl-phosphate phosphoribosyltransferase [Prevotella sp.]
MKNLLKLIRPSQWIKNFFVFGPIVFGGELLNGHAMLAGLITFMAFSFAASSVYCFNDIHDVADDRRHPEKCRRPIASGAVSVPQAYGLMALMFILGIGILVLMGLFGPANPAQPMPDSLSSPMLKTAGVIVFYWVLNLAYCAKLKQYAIIDVCIVAFGFVLRLLAGGVATGIVLSKWIVLMTFLITLFMSFAKRRDDVLRMEATGEAPRKNTIHYNTTFINQAITITAGVTLVCYIMYTVSPEVIAQFHNGYLYLTSVFVLVGLLRYIQIAVVEKKSGNPTKVILKDHFIQLVVAAWFVSFLLIIYVI